MCALSCGTRDIRLQRNESIGPPRLFPMPSVRTLMMVGEILLTFYAMVEEPPKDRSEYYNTYAVLKDHLCPNGPVEEPSI